MALQIFVLPMLECHCIIFFECRNTASEFSAVDVLLDYSDITSANTLWRDCSRHGAFYYVGTGYAKKGFVTEKKGTELD
jgi:hypothetical protein